MQGLRLNKRLSRALFSIASSSSSSFSHNTDRTLTTLTQSTWNLLSSPDCHAAADLQSSPWSAIQHRGVKVNASHVRPGNVIEKSGRIYQVLDAEHKQRGRGGAMMTLELRDVDSGSKQSLRFGTEESVERVFVEEQTVTCLYTENDTAYLMDTEKFEQLEVPLELFGNAAPYLKEEMKVKLQVYDGRPLSGSIPKQVTCSVKEVQSASTHRYKKAVLDNGLTVQVPPFIELGEEIIVNTDDNSYITRAN